MENHHVKNLIIPQMPSKRALTPVVPFKGREVVGAFLLVLPVVAFSIMWLAAQLKDLLQGDFQDRNMMRKRMFEREEEDKAVEREDNKLVGLQKMVIGGMDEGAPLPTTCLTLLLQGKLAVSAPRRHQCWCRCCALRECGGGVDHAVGCVALQPPLHKAVCIVQQQ